MDSAILHALAGHVNFFQSIDLDVLRTSSNRRDYSVLAIAAENGHLHCCQVIYARCPELLYRVSKHKKVSVLQCAAYNGKLDIVKFFLNANSKGDEEVGIEGGIQVDSKLLMMVNDWGNTALHDAVNEGHYRTAKFLLEVDHSNKLLGMKNNDGNTVMHIAVENENLELVKLFVEKDNKLLGMINNEGNTVMHIAVENENLEFVKLFVEKDNQIVYSPNKSGAVPLTVALSNAIEGDETTIAIRKLMIKKQPRRCQDSINNRGWTLLHYAVDKRDLNTIKEILGLCPESSETVDNEEQNFLHLAATLELESIVRNVLALLNVSEKTLNHQEKNGDTPLHIATFSKSEGLAKVLLYDARVKIDIQNKKGKSALDAITFDYDKRRARYGFTSRADEKELKNQSDFDLLVGALICTVSFTAGITVPGGFHSDGPNKGTAMLYKKTSFMTFILSNTFAFVLSLYAVFSHYCTRHVGDEKYIIRQFRLASFCTLGSIFALVVAFISGSFAVLNVSQTLTISICVICGFFFMFACEPMGRMIWERIQRSRTSE